MKHPKEETTLALIKPDGVRRGLTGEIISRIEQRNLKIIGLQMIRPNKKQMNKHYPNNKEWIKNLGEKTLMNYKKYGYNPKKEFGTEDPFKIGKLIRQWLINFMISGPIVKIAIKGIHSTEMIRKIVGPTIPALAEMGTIRGDFSVDSSIAANRDKRSIHNIVHASGNKKEAEKELSFWFSPKEIHQYKRKEEEIMF